MNAINSARRCIQFEGTTPVRASAAEPREVRTLYTGFLLVGLAVAVTAVSYVLNMTFSVQWLVWVIGFAFAAVALLSLEWPRGFCATGRAPRGKFRFFLLLSMPLAYVLGSQICGTGLNACGPLGNDSLHRRGQPAHWVPMGRMCLTT